MLRRLALSAVALTALSLVTAGVVAAQDQGAGMSGAGTAGMSQGPSGMGPAGTPGVGPGPVGLPVPAMPGMIATRSASGALTADFRTPIHHPGDLSGLIPCTGCGVIADPCSFRGQCQYAEEAMWPETIGLHPTTNQPELPLYFPQGPLSCARGRGDNPASCVDAPGEWNLRSGMPSDSGGMGGASR
ncbi:MAG TPA: hypothetical protein VK066_13235 [Chloroflexota bacterium]|nr:hypothetical protein [Chloroflexota bacterium]